MLLCPLQLLGEGSSYDQVSHDHRSYERNLSNCVEKPEKVRTSTGFEPVLVMVLVMVNRTDLAMS